MIFFIDYFSSIIEIFLYIDDYFCFARGDVHWGQMISLIIIFFSFISLSIT